jgi:amidase
MDAFSPATELAAAIRARHLSPVELLTDCLETVDRLNPVLNAVIWRDDGAALDEARRIGDALAKGADDLGPFAGVPLPIKDLDVVRGWPRTNGSRATGETSGEDDDLVVGAFRRAGFVLSCRTNTPEFGTVTATENLRHGVTRNPWDPTRTPGGSSGGAAAATASGMFPLAHANDGGGSIRIPASCTGLVGLKPSRYRVPAVAPGWMGAAVQGAVTRTVTDAAAVLDQISGPDPLAWANAPAPERPFADEVGADPGRLRVGLLTRAPLDLPVAAAPAEAVQVAGRALESVGHHVETVDFELFTVDALVHFLPVVNAGVADYPDLDPDLLEPHNRAGYDTAQQVDSITFLRAVNELQRYTRTVVARWGTEFDLLVTPTLAIEPPVAGSILEAAHAAPGAPPDDVLSMAAFNAPFNVSGQPSISLPLHTAPSGLPVGVQLVPGPWQESLLIRVAAQLEQALPWADRRPALDALVS